MAEFAVPGKPKADTTTRAPRPADVARAPLHEGGSGLPGGIRADLERAFGADFSGVSVRGSGATGGVQGTARDEEVRIAPMDTAGYPREHRRLLAHEFAHVLQQRHGLQQQHGGAAPVGHGSTASLENEARQAADVVAAGGRASVSGAAPVGAAQHSELSETVRTAATKGAVFDALRSQPAEQRADPAVLREVRARFAQQPDDLWLAETIVRSGPEPLWSAADLTERSRRATGTHPWAAEAGNIAAGVVDPDPDVGTGRVAPRKIDPIPVYLFPGTEPDLRALIIGGVHGNEPEGREVVERLRAQLAKESAEGRPPRFTTILVPELIVATHHPYGERPAFETRLLPAGSARSKPGKVEPNRNLPFPGVSYQEARKLGAGGKPELETLPSDEHGNPIYSEKPRTPRDTSKFSTSSERMLPETRALLSLMERFNPQRIVSVHAHRLTKGVGDAPGVFVDPRGIDPRTGAVKDSAAVTADDALTTELMSRAVAYVPTSLRAGSFAGTLPAPVPPRPTCATARQLTARATRWVCTDRCPPLPGRARPPSPSRFRS